MKKSCIPKYTDSYLREQMLIQLNTLIVLYVIKGEIANHNCPKFLQANVTLEMILHLKRHRPNS